MTDASFKKKDKYCKLLYRSAEMHDRQMLASRKKTSTARSAEMRDRQEKRQVLQAIYRSAEMHGFKNKDDLTKHTLYRYLSA